MAHGLVAPEGVYLPTYSYLLPPPPAYPPPAAANATLQAYAAKESVTSPTSINGSVYSSTSGSLGSTGGNNAAAALANQNTNIAASSSTGSSSGGGGAAAAAAAAIINGGDLNDIAALNADGDQLKTALHHISLQAPSAWGHVPIIPPSKISVASIRLPANNASRRERQQSSYASTAEVQEADNESDGSLSGTDGGRGVGSMSGSTNFDPVASTSIGPVLEAALASQGIDGLASHVTGGAGGLPGMAALQLLAHLGGGPPATTAVDLASGIPNLTNFTGSSKGTLKLKNNIKQTSSSFVQRLQNHNDYTKLIGTVERFAFISRGRIIYWLGETSNGWLKDPLSRLIFATTIASHDINQFTRSSSRLDVAIAFTTSDIIWFEAMSSRYTRLNKSGCVNDSPITNIRWVPGSETLLLTSHSDGTCTMFDISREDSASGTWTPVHGITATDENGRSNNISTPEGVGLSRKPMFRSWDPTKCILVTRPTIQEAASEAASKKIWSKLNPVAHWRVARFSSITDVAFSPDHTKLAVVSTDGLLRIINLMTETLEGSFESYYGALNKVVFSPDAKFILTAGCDDLISVWTNDGRLLSRCPGHSSFVRGLAFDPWRWKVEDKTYRFASIGEDGKLFLWDFSSAALVRPKATPNSASFQRRIGHGGSTFSLLQDQRRPSGTRRASMAGGEGEVKSTSAIYSRALPRAEVAELQPVASYQLGGTPLNDQIQSTIIPSASTTGTLNVVTPTTGSAASGNITLTSPNHATTIAAANAAANEPGSANDLLVDVRFRPDGIIIMHKSGSMRFLQRPRHRSNSRFSSTLDGTKSRNKRHGEGIR